MREVMVGSSSSVIGHQPQQVRTIYSLEYTRLEWSKIKIFFLKSFVITKFFSPNSW
jgi:hypothetical protein